MPDKDYRDMVALLHETGGPDGGPLLQSAPPAEETEPETTAASVNAMRRQHRMG